MSYFPRRSVFCPYSEFERLQSKYPNRQVFPDKHCPNDCYYYADKRGVFKCVKVKDGSIWEPIYEEDGWPSTYQRRVR